MRVYQNHSYSSMWVEQSSTTHLGMYIPPKKMVMPGGWCMALFFFTLQMTGNVEGQAHGQGEGGQTKETGSLVAKVFPPTRLPLLSHCLQVNASKA